MFAVPSKPNETWEIGPYTVSLSYAYGARGTVYLTIQGHEHVHASIRGSVLTPAMVVLSPKRAERVKLGAAEVWWDMCDRHNSPRLYVEGDRIAAPVNRPAQPRFVNISVGAGEGRS